MIAKNALILVVFFSFISGSSEISAQNPRADGYKGLWSAAVKSPEFGYRFSGGLATYSSNHNPVAIFSPQAGKTFFVYGGTQAPDVSHLQVMISYFDHKTRQVPKPVIIIDKEGVSEAQDNATISIDSSGFIYVFVSGMGRTRPGYIYKSTLPYSIEQFDLIKEGEIVFPQPWWVKDSCFVLLYTKYVKGRELFCSTGKDGKMWSKPAKIAALGGSNQVTSSDGNKVVTVFNIFRGGNPDRQTNLYFLQSSDAGKTWKTIEGKEVSIPLTDIHNDAIIKDYQPERKLVFIKSVSFDPSGNPVILILTSNDFRPGPEGDPREWIVVHRKRGEWVFSKVCQSNNNYDMGSLYINDNEWRIVGTTEQGGKKYTMGGELALWRSTDSGYTWEKHVDITTRSNLNNSFPRSPLNANQMFYSFWSDGDPEKLSACHLYFTDESCKKVWILPYNMKRDFEKPMRLKK